MQAWDFNERPFLVIWETTHACDLACVHCRAEAVPEADPEELTTTQAFKLIDDVKEMKTPILIFSGGDPLKRKDLPELIRYAKTKNLRAGAIPAVTPLLTHEKIQLLKDSGLDQLAFSLDASTPEEHDAFRRVSGVFQRTMDSIHFANQIGLPLQINSLINVHNTEKMDKLIGLIEGLDIVFWEVFFLVPTGRGKDIPLLTASKFDEAFEKIYQLSRRVKFVTKVTEAQHYRRFVHEKEASSHAEASANGDGKIEMPASLRKRVGPGGTIGHAPQGVNSGKGFVFISYKGDVMPSGFLPIKAGNVKNQSLADIYRNAPIMKELRDVSLLKGKCGPCEYNEICGGSRARAYAMTGDYLAEDPCCSYELPRKAVV